MKKPVLYFYTMLFLVLNVNLLRAQIERKGEVPPEMPRVLNIDVLDPVKYTANAIRKGIEGSVTVEITVDTAGNYVHHELIEADHEWLADAVEPYLKDLKFRPARINGDAVEAKKQIKVHFNILRKIPPKTEIKVEY